jgi:hypothetical protein
MSGPARPILFPLRAGKRPGLDPHQENSGSHRRIS